MARLRSRFSTEDVASQLTRAGWAVRVVDVAGVRDKAELLDAFATALGFPAWVGRNWDALDDALRDLSWWAPGERGRAMIVAGAGRLDDALDAEWATLCDVLATATERWSETSTPLGVLVRGRALA
ncbi:MAG: barstar family protein [Chloroflexota bacterium]